MSKNAHTLFETYLSNNDSRYTSQKKAIASEIFQSKDHFEVEDFIDKIRAKDKKFSRATVYRTIKQLLEARLLQKISSIDGKILYEHSTPQDHHAHVICNICGKIFEIEENAIKSIIDTECKKLGVIPQYLSLHVYGQCENPATCKSKK
jgi:Fur family transcriptional regulator, ferric uptake regulator